MHCNTISDFKYITGIKFSIIQHTNSSVCRKSSTIEQRQSLIHEIICKIIFSKKKKNKVKKESIKSSKVEGTDVERKINRIEFLYLLIGCSLNFIFSIYFLDMFIYFLKKWTSSFLHFPLSIHRIKHLLTLHE